MTSTRYSIKVLNHYFVRLKLNFTLDVKRNLNKKLKKKKKKIPWVELEQHLTYSRPIYLLLSQGPSVSLTNVP